MAGQEAIPVHGGEADGPCASREVEQLLRLVREVVLPEFEPVLRSMIREEMQNVLLGCTYPTLRIPSNHNQASITRRFQLHFNNELPEIIFTGNIVEPKGNAPVQIFITDADKRKITLGPLSTIKIEILVLDGDFGDEEQGSWTEEEFNKYVLRERKGRGPLLKGNQFITLEGGVGNLCSISFTDNSKWTRAQKFRLGARALQDDLVEERIQEAISEAFYVNDHRGEYTMKHDTPLLKDEVWRLKNIRKDGPYHRRLLDHGIITVEDFLKSLVMDEDKLCRILFGKKIANKKWNTIVQHARKCDLGHKCYSYIVPGQRVELAFNSVFEVIAVRFGDCMWQRLCQLPKPQQDLVNRLKYDAYGNQNAMVELNDPTNSLSVFPSALLATYTPEANPTDLHPTNVQISHEAVYETDALSGSWDPSVPICTEDSNHVEGQQQTCFAMDGCKMDGVFDQEARFAMESCNMDGVLGWNTGGYETESCSNITTAHHVSWNNPAIHISRSKWAKLRFTIKLGASIRKRVSARRSARIQQIRWFSLLAAVRFGRSIRKRAVATRRARLLNSEQSWTHEFSPLPFVNMIWPEEEGNYF